MFKRTFCLSDVMGMVFVDKPVPCNDFATVYHILL